jgi:hypothetical protein
MSRRPKLDPMSVLVSIKKKMAAHRPAPLASLPREEIAAFQKLRELIEPGKLLPYLDKREKTAQGERIVCINEELVGQHFPGVDPLNGRLPGIDAFIYVYDGITGHDRAAPKNRGDLRQFLGEVGFRQLLLELDKACKIHRFCADHLSPDRIVIEPLTKKPAIDARKAGFAIPARAKEVFQQFAKTISDEMAATAAQPPQVYQDAFQFARAMSVALEPLAMMGKQIRGR